MKKLILVLLVISLGSGWGANHYVRQGASGNGSDWANALGQLPASLVRGDTYYIADGTYPGRTFNDPAAGQQYITIKKAMAGDHGTDTGWQPGYGDGTAAWTGQVQFMKSYYVFDGQTGGGPGNWQGPYGFTNPNLGWGIMIGDKWNGTLTGDLNHIEIRHMELYQTALNHEELACGDVKGIDLTDPKTTKSDLVFSHLSVHDVGIQFHVMHSRNVVVEYCYFARNSSNAACHSEFWSDFNGSDSLTFRYNLFEDIEGTAVFAWVNGSGTAYNWRIYGNILFYSGDYTDGDGVSGVIFTDYTCRDWQVHNNTIVNGQGLWSGFRVGTSSSGCVAYNNLWYDCVRTAHYNFSLSHSWYDTGMNRDGDNTSVQLGTADPLINWADGDFHLKAATNAGHTLAAPFNQDMYGNTRGADGTWDRGAIEFTATNIGIFDFQLPNADCPTLPNPIMLMGINGLKLMTDNLRFYNIAGGRVPVSRLDQAGLYLAADAGIIHKLVLVK